jgi:hypothetical protein
MIYLLLFLVCGEPEYEEPPDFGWFWANGERIEVTQWTL